MATRKRISTHFRVEEFDCRNGQRVPALAHGPLMHWATLWGEPLRTKFGPVMVTSGYRPEGYNRSIGGAPASFHVYDAPLPGRKSRRAVTGVAVDVTCAEGTAGDWLNWASTHRARTASLSGVGVGGIGYYPGSGFLHLDTGPLRSWAGS